MAQTKNLTYIDQLYEDFDQYERIRFKLPDLDVSQKQSVLDLGCAKGQVLYSLIKSNFSGDYVGVDNDPNMLNLALKYFDDNYIERQYQFVLDDTANFLKNSNKKFDLILCWGLLSFYDEFEPLLEQSLQILSDHGEISLWSGFTDNDYNVFVKYQKPGQNLQAGLNMFGLSNIKKYLDKQGCRYNIKKFEIDIDLNQDHANPLKTWTEKTKKGNRFLINGLNIRRDFFHIIIKK